MNRVDGRSFAALRRVAAACALAALGACATAQRGPAAKGISVRSEDGSVHLSAEGAPLASLALRAGAPLIVFALASPRGTAVLRDDPARSRSRRDIDHPEQRSLWVAYGDVGGVDLWARPELVRLVDHEVQLRRGGALELRASLRWNDGEGRLLLNEERCLRFGATDHENVLDVDIALTAAAAGVRFGDTKDGLLALRLGEAFTEPAGAVAFTPLRAGTPDSPLWGDASRWLAVTAARRPGDDGRVTVAVLDHPGNLQHPARWQVRPYGLIAANPFGLAAFAGDRSSAPALNLPPHGTVRLRYRVVVTDVDVDAAEIDARWRAFAEEAHPGDARTAT